MRLSLPMRRLFSWRAVLCAGLLAAMAVAGRADVEVPDEGDIPDHEISPESVISWVFGGSPRLAAINQAERALETRLRLLDRSTGLSASQRERLDLAGRGDIARFFEEYEVLRRSRPQHQIRRDEYMSYYERCNLLRTQWTAGLHGRGSLLQKMVPVVLDADQRKRLDAARLAAQERQHTELMQGVIDVIDLQVSLSEPQKKQVLELLTAKTEIVLVEGGYKGDERTFVRSLDKISEEEWMRIIPEPDWPRAGRAIRRYVGRSREALGQ